MLNDNNANTIDNEMIETFCRMIDVIDVVNNDIKNDMFDVCTMSINNVNNNNIECNELCDMLISTM